MSLVSVVIPAYNQARFVRQAVQSVLDQTHRWVEVIVVDDGSTDETGEVLREFRSVPNVTVIRQLNSGLPAARNRGVLDARGEFLCFLDSDDFLAPTHIARLLEPLSLDDTLALAYCDVQTVNVDGAPAGDFSVGSARREVTGDIFGSLLMGGYFPPHTVLVRRSVIDEVGDFDADLGGHADYELWLRISALGHRAHYVDARLAHYRVYDGSMSRDREHMRLTRIGALERISRQFPSRTANALSAVQELAVDLHTANVWLRTQWEQALERLAPNAPPAAWSLVDRFSDATLSSGSVQQLGLWDVPEGNDYVRCVFLHAPAALRAIVPCGSAGRLTASVGLHPDVWTKAEASGCTFSITVDEKTLGAVTLDPLTSAGDRRWVSLSLDVPATTAGHHVVMVETQVVGTGYFAWGMFRDVRFQPAQG